MEKAMSIRMLLCSFFVALALNACPATSQEVDDEREFDYVQGGDRGPDRWGEIHRDWSTCEHGNMQSPIDLVNGKAEGVSHLGKLQRRYKRSKAILRNRGHDMMLRWEGDAGWIRVNGTRYGLRQCHWHSPSEHAVDAKRFDLELHVIHETPSRELAVIGIMYKIGKADSFLSMLTDHLANFSGGSEEVKELGVVDPRRIKIGSAKYYRYTGSVTVPPCTEGVIWTVVHKVRTVTREQVSLLRSVVHDNSDSNARPLQPLNERSLYLTC